MRKGDIKKTLKDSMPKIREKYNVNSLSLFGSYPRNEQREDSDVDILVDFLETTDLFSFVELENLLSDILGKRVDLVMKTSLKPRIKDKVLEESVAI